MTLRLFAGGCLFLIAGGLANAAPITATPVDIFSAGFTGSASVPQFNSPGQVLDSVNLMLNWSSDVSGWISFVEGENGTEALKTVTLAMKATISQGGNVIMTAPLSYSWTNLRAQLPYYFANTGSGSASGSVLGGLSGFTGAGNVDLSVQISKAVFTFAPNNHRYFTGSDMFTGTVDATYTAHQGQISPDQSQVPEPASMALVGSALLAAVALARRKRV